MRTYHTLKTVAALGLLAGLQALHAQPLTGTHNINGTSAFNASGGSFATIQEAFDSLNQRGALGLVTFNVQNGWDPANEPNTITLAGYACTNCLVTLDFSPLTTLKVLSKAPAGAAGGRFVFRFGGHTQSTLGTVNNPGQITNFTLVGSPSNLIVRSTATGATTTGVIGVVSTTSASLAVDGLAIQALRIEGNGRSNTFSGIYVGPDASLTSGAPTGTVQGLRIVANAIDSVSRPIHIRGVRANFGTINKPITIDSNRIGLASNTSWAAANNIGGIHVAGARFINIRNNEVTGAQSGTNYLFAGIRLDSCEHFDISRNHIYSLKYTGGGGWGMYGIAVILPGAFSLPNPLNVVSNNMIADIVGDADNSTSGIFLVSGIFVNSSATLPNAQLSLIHNSIHLFGNNTNSSYSGGGSAAICIGSGITGGVDIYGNILQNNLTASTAAGKLAVGVWILSGSYTGTNINYNAYRVNATGANVTNYVAKIDANNYPTLVNWQGTGREAAGVDLSADVPFVSATDLHVDPTAQTQIINAGSTAYNGTQDFDGQTRPLPNPGPGLYGDPGTAPDIGADELDGTPLSCPSSLGAPDVVSLTPPNAGTDYLWGTAIQLDTTGTNSVTASGALKVIYSLDGGVTWTAGPSVSAFPASFTLPSLTPPNYTGTIHIAIEATSPSGCPSLPADTSNAPLVLNLTERPGNRAVNAIPLTLTAGSGGVWSAILSDSTNGPGISDEFNLSTGARYGAPSRDLFFTFTLPACFDSLRVYTCGNQTFYDTRIHLINATQPDSLSNDDGSSPSDACNYLIPPNTSRPYASRIIAADNLPKNTNRVGTSIYSLLRDSLPLRSGDMIYVVVEGYLGEEGRFTLTIEGYAPPALAKPDLGSDQTICVTQTSLTLSTSPVTGATTYEWLLNGTVIPGTNSDSYTLTSLSPGTHEVILRAIRVSSNPYWGSVCNDTTADTVEVVVAPEPTTTAQVGSNSYNNGDVINVSGTGTSVSVTFTASSQNTTPTVTYSWALYPDAPPIPSTSTALATGAGSSFTYNFTSAGSYGLVLVSDNGGCVERDTFTVNVSLTTALAAAQGSFRAYPNPTIGAFTVEMPVAGRYTLQVLDAAGKLVHSQVVENTLSQEVRLNVPAGVYQLVISGEGRREVIRLVVNP